MAKKSEAAVLMLDGREVRVTHPDKPYFSRQAKLSKLEVVRYFLSVAPGVLAGIRDRPLVLKRFVDGAEGEPFYQKRAPAQRPAWLKTVTLSFPSGRTAEELVVDDAAGLAWVVNLGCIELHPHPVRASDLDHPDELRVDLDPQPGTGFAEAAVVAAVLREVLAEAGMVGYPKTSGGRGIHVAVRIRPQWSFVQVRRAVIALAREVARRIPQQATVSWWKEERGQRVFLDFNQAARDRTIASAWSVRGTPRATVSMPVGWDDLTDVHPDDFDVLTVPALFAQRGDPHAGLDSESFGLELLLEWALRDEHDHGLGDLPYPPEYPKMPGEPLRVQPSRAKRRNDSS